MSVVDLEGAAPSFEHHAVFYSGAGGLVDAVVPFVRDGLANDEPVLVALPPERLAAVERELGADASEVELVDMHELGGNPARIIPEWRRFLADRGGSRPVRGVGEPVWAGRRNAELSEAALHEALLNLAFDDGVGWQLICPYDSAALPQSVLEQATRSHPVARGALPGEGYGGHDHALEQFTALLPDPPEQADLLPFARHDLAGLRSSVATLARHAGLSGEEVDGLVLAAHEVATNSVVHGGGAGELRAWGEADAFIVEVRDPGVITDPLVGRGLLSDVTEDGRGIWMANQLCDLVQVRSSSAGTTVRLFAWL
jgi:anti-sigma regulatory factor (Ser/Thr protein kinase)